MKVNLLGFQKMKTLRIIEPVCCIIYFLLKKRITLCMRAMKCFHSLCQVYSQLTLSGDISTLVTDGLFRLHKIYPSYL